MRIGGIGVSPAMAMARAYVLERPKPTAGRELLAPQEVEPELARLRRGVAGLDNLYRRSLSQLPHEHAAEQAQVLTMHRALLHDEELLRAVEWNIRRGMPAPAAVEDAAKEQSDLLLQADSRYFRERVQDIQDVTQRLIFLLLGVGMPDLSALGRQLILVAQDIAPSDMAVLDPRYVRGIVTGEGSLTSHTAIIAKSMGIAAVMGCAQAMDVIENEDLLFVDGVHGLVEVAPAQWRIPALHEEMDQYTRQQQALLPYRDRPTRTRDGQSIELLANIADTSVLDRVNGDRADGVGLMRTEFFFQDRLFLPSEEEQYVLYQGAVQGMGGRPVTIRTIDVGGDKEILSLGIHQEPNSLLGLRGIRFCLRRPDVFLPQLRAILRAGAQGNLQVLYPMVGSLEELLQAKEQLAKAKASLREEGAAFAATPPEGIMVEIPSAALLSDRLIEHCDFISVGTNDLTQYVTAADRLNPAVFRANAHFDPGLLRLVQMTLENCAAAKKPCCICGEMASQPAAALLLLGMGARRLSVNPSAILPIRRLITMTTLEQAQAAAEKALAACTAKEAEEIALAALTEL